MPQNDEESAEGPGEDPLTDLPAEVEWEGRTRLGPDWVIRAVAVVLPLVGIWLVWTVAARKMRWSDEPRAAARMDPAMIGTRTPREVALDFLEAKSMDQRLDLSYRPSLTGEHARNFGAGALEMPTRFDSILDLGPVTAMQEIRYYRFGVELPGGSKRLLCVVDTADGLRVDWDAFARYGTVPASGPHQTDFTEATVRVFVRKAGYYNYRFSDDRNWACFALWNPDWESTIHGYARREATTAKILSRLAARGSRTAPGRAAGA